MPATAAAIIAAAGENAKLGAVTTKKNERSKNGSSAPLDTLKSVYDFMVKNDLNSVEIVEDGAQIKLVRRKSPQVQVPVAVPVPSTGGSVPTPFPTATAPTVATPQAIPTGQSIKSPMMGIFYRASSPSSPPFVKDGDPVKPGQVLCMIEAMKVFNEIKVEFPCTILRSLVENGKPVKSGQDLFLIQR